MTTETQQEDPAMLAFELRDLSDELALVMADAGEAIPDAVRGDARDVLARCRRDVAALQERVAQAGPR